MDYYCFAIQFFLNTTYVSPGANCLSDIIPMSLFHAHRRLYYLIITCTGIVSSLTDNTFYDMFYVRL